MSTVSWGNCFCTKCGQPLPDHLGEPLNACPDCGSAGIIKRASANLTAGATVHAKAQAHYDRTGRIFTGDERLIMIEHKDWSELPTREAMLQHRLASRFRGSLHDAPAVTGTLSGFRARHLAPGVIATSNDCGPSPSPNPGRYNAPGVAVLYLGETVEAVRAELGSGASPRWLQKFVIPETPGGLRIGDFSGLAADHPTSQAFWFAEIKNRDTRYPNEYLFSQVVAELVRTFFPGGMRVRGTRPAAAFYRNVALFEHADWKDWTVGDPFKDGP